MCVRRRGGEGGESVCERLGGVGVVWASFLALKATLSTLHPLLWGPAEALPREKPLGFDFLEFFTPAFRGLYLVGGWWVVVVVVGRIFWSNFDFFQSCWEVL